MSQKLTLNKTVYSKEQYENTVNTQFSTPSTDQTQQTVTQLPTVEEFFNYYTQLFYDIPKLGPTNSHQYLITESSDYANVEQTNEDLTALLEEIDQLREQNLQLQQQVLQLSANQNG